MHLADELLATIVATIFSVARRVGDNSEEAFGPALTQSVKTKRRSISSRTPPRWA